MRSLSYSHCYSLLSDQNGGKLSRDDVWMDLNLGDLPLGSLDVTTWRHYYTACSQGSPRTSHYLVQSVPPQCVGREPSGTVLSCSLRLRQWEELAVSFLARNWSAEASCSGLGNVCFQLWYFYTNDINSSKRVRMVKCRTPRSLQSSVLALCHIKKVVPCVKSKWYVFLICYQTWEEPHIQTKSPKCHAPVLLPVQVTSVYIAFSSSVPLKNTISIQHNRVKSKWEDKVRSANFLFTVNLQK